MKIAVLGSGIIGVSTAWWLNQMGHEVVVVERQPQAGLETSRANGGQISVSYAEPWASPQVLPKLVKWLLRDNAPLAFRLQFDPHQWSWAFMFLRECMPARVARNVAALVAMAQYSRRTLQEMRRELGIEYDQQERGILNFYRSMHEFEASQKMAGIMRDHGVERRVIAPTKWWRSNRLWHECVTRSWGATTPPTTNRATRSASRRNWHVWRKTPGCSSGSAGS